MNNHTSRTRILGRTKASRVAAAILAMIVVTIGSAAMQTDIAHATPNWTNLGPEGGYFKSFAFHSNGYTVLAGGDDSSGIWKSDDYGGHWYLVSANFPNFSAWDIIYDPTDSSIAYAVDEYGRYPILKSTDGGNTWVQKTSGLTARRVNSITVDPGNHTTLYVGTGYDTERGGGDGVWKSTNGGNSWSQVALDNTLVRNVRAKSANTVFATTLTGVVKTTNGGTSWTTLSGGLPSGEPTVLEVSPAGSLWVGYFGLATNSIYKSTDSGANWTGKGLGGKGVFDIAVRNSNENHVYVATIGDGVQKTTNGGTSWAGASTNIESDLIISIGYDATNNYLYSSTYGNTGIYFSSDNAANWYEINIDLKAYYATGLSVDPNNANKMFVTSLGPYYSDPNANTARTYKGTVGAGGVTWSLLNSTKAQTYALSVKPGDSNTIIYGSWDQGFYWSTNGGTTVTRPAVTSGAVTATAFDPDNASVTVASHLNLSTFATTIYYTTNGGSSWSSAAMSGGGLVNAFLAEGGGSSRLWAATSSGIFLSTNNGSTWTSKLSGDFNTIVKDPANANTYYVGGANGDIRKTTNTGTSWSAVSHPTWVPGAHIRSLVFHPSDSTKLYVALDGSESIVAGADMDSLGGGVFLLQSGTWSDLTGDLPNNQVRGMVIATYSGTKYLYVATYGGSVSRIAL